MILTILDLIGNLSRYAFLIMFLGIIIGVIVFSIIRSKNNPNSPTAKSARHTPIYEMVVGIVAVVGLAGGAISFILLENFILGGILIGVFVVSVLGFAVVSSITRITITIMGPTPYDPTTKVFYSKKEFEARLVEGTLNLDNCRIKYPRGYIPSEHVRVFLEHHNDNPF